MIRLSSGLLVVVLADSAVAVGRMRERVLAADPGAAIVAEHRREVVLEVPLTLSTQVVRMLRDSDSAKMIRPHLIDEHGIGRRRGKGERKKNRGSRWA